MIPALRSTPSSPAKIRLRSSVTIGCLAVATPLSILPVIGRGDVGLPASAAPVVQSVTFSANDIGAGQTVTGTVRLDQPATKAGLTIQLSSNSGLAQVPTSISLKPAATTGTFEVRTSFGRLGCPRITARVGTTAPRSDLLYITSATTFSRGTPALNLLLGANPAVSGSRVAATVNLASIAGENAVVTLGSGDPTVATVPASITVPLGSRTATFNIGTSVSGQNSCAEITATFGSTTSRRLLKVATISG